MNKKFRLQATLFVVLMIGIFTSAYPVIYFNRGDCAFAPGCDPGDGGESGLYVPSGSGMMAMYIVEGAGYVLDARAAMSTFMSRFEMSELTGTDFLGMRDGLSDAIDNLEKAKSIYIFIEFLAANTAYNEPVIERLKVFDYDGFQKKWGLYPNVFDRVKGYLSRGDVRGVWTAVSKDIDQLLLRLYALKSYVTTYKLPTVQSVWQLNQVFSDNFFFGQYFAMVMYEVK